jgi:hypothetical protein
MTGTFNITLEKKKENYQHILANLDKYVLDPKGNFVNIDFDTYGKDNYYIGRNSLDK